MDGSIGSLRNALYDALQKKPAAEITAAEYPATEYPSKAWKPGPTAPTQGRKKFIMPRRSPQAQQEAAARAVEAQKLRSAAPTPSAADDAPAPDATNTAPIAADAALVATSSGGGAPTFTSPVTRRWHKLSQGPAQAAARSPSPSPSSISVPASPIPPPVASPLAAPAPAAPAPGPVTESAEAAVQHQEAAPPQMSHLRVSAALHALYVVLATAASPAALAATRGTISGADSPFAGSLDGQTLVTLARHTPQARDAPGGALDSQTLDAVLRAAMNRLVGNVVIRAVDNPFFPGELRFSIHNGVQKPQAPQALEEAPAGYRADEGGHDPSPHASDSPAPSMHGAQEQRQECHDEAEAADALLGVAGTASSEEDGDEDGGAMAPAGAFRDHGGGSTGKRPRASLVADLDDGSGAALQPPLAKVMRTSVPRGGGTAGRGGRGGGGGRRAALGAGPGFVAPPAAAFAYVDPFTPTHTMADALLNNVQTQMLALRHDLWHSHQELNTQMTALRTEMRAQTDAVLHCLERLCVTIFQTPAPPHAQPSAPMLPVGATTDEMASLRTEVLKLRQLLQQQQVQNLATPEPRVTAADMTLAAPAAADRVARAVHLPLRRPGLLPPLPMWAPPARASPAVDAAGVARAIAASSGEGPIVSVKGTIN